MPHGFETFTKTVTLENDYYLLSLAVEPDTDLDTRFKAWDLDCNECVYVNGYMFTEIDAE